MLGPADRVDLEQANTWEQSSVTSWEKREEHVVGDNCVPLPPSFRLRQKHKNNLEDFFGLEVASYDAFKELVARKRLKLAPPCEEQNVTHRWQPALSPGRHARTFQRSIAT